MNRDSLTTAGPRRVPGANLVALLTPLALAAVGALALWLRWDRLAYASFRGDQAWSINRALDFVAKGDFPLTGIRSSVGTAQGPIEIYLLALPVAVSPDPVIATAFVGFLQVLAVLGTYFVVARYFGRGPGLLAATLFAANPWAVNFARRIWTQDMLPLFTVLLVAALFAAVVEHRRLFFAFACAAQVALLLLHPSAVLYLPLLALVAVLFWRDLGPRALLLGALLGLLVAAPYLYGEYLSGFPSLNAYLGLAGKGGDPNLAVLDALPTLASGAQFPWGMSDTFAGDWSLPDLRPQHAVTTALVYLGLAFAVGRVALALRSGEWRRAGSWRAYLLLALWFVVPALLSTRNSVGANLSYFIVLYPLQFVLVAVALSDGARLLGRLSTFRSSSTAGNGSPSSAARLLFPVLAVALLAYVALPQVVLFGQYLGYMERNGPRGAHGIPLLYAQQAAAQMREVVAGERVPAAYYFGTGSQGLALRYLARPDFDLRRVDPNVGPLLPADLAAGALAVVGPEDEAARDLASVPTDGPVASRLAQIGFVEAPERAVRGAGGVVYFRFYRLPPQAPASGGVSLPPGFRPAPRRATLPGGLRLVGYSLPAAARPGEKAPLALVWSVDGDLERYRYSGDVYLLFAHLVDGQGRLVGNVDSDPFASDDWRRGDLLTTLGEYELPAEGGPGLLWVEVGAFKRYGRDGLNWTPAEGGAPFAAQRVGPLKVAPAKAIAPPANAVSFRFGEAISLTGYDLQPARPRPGENLSVALRWRALAAPAADYTVSVQLLDASGRLVAQHDGQPVAGAYPTSYWAAGETVSDSHTLALPPSVPAGEYTLSVVVYSQPDGKRLPVTGASGETAQVAVAGTVQVGE